MSLVIHLTDFDVSWVTRLSIQWNKIAKSIQISEQIQYILMEKPIFKESEYYLVPNAVNLLRGIHNVPKTIYNNNDNMAVRCFTAALVHGAFSIKSMSRVWIIIYF